MAIKDTINTSMRLLRNVDEKGVVVGGGGFENQLSIHMKDYASKCETDNAILSDIAHAYATAVLTIPQKLQANVGIDNIGQDLSICDATEVKTAALSYATSTAMKCLLAQNNQSPVSNRKRKRISYGPFQSPILSSSAATVASHDDDEALQKPQPPPPSPQKSPAVRKTLGIQIRSPCRYTLKAPEMQKVKSEPNELGNDADDNVVTEATPNEMSNDTDKAGQSTTAQALVPAAPTVATGAIPKKMKLGDAGSTHDDGNNGNNNDLTEINEQAATTSSKKKLVCKHCKKVYSSTSTLNRHILQQHNENDRKPNSDDDFESDDDRSDMSNKSRCPHCKKMLQSPLTLALHIKNFHPKNENLKNAGKQ